MKDNKYKYQIITVLNPKTEDKDAVLKKISAWIEGASGTIVTEDHMGQKELAYEINSHRKGDFYLYEVESEKTMQVKELNLFLNREPNIIRYLILKK